MIKFNIHSRSTTLAFSGVRVRACSHSLDIRPAFKHSRVQEKAGNALPARYFQTKTPRGVATAASQGSDESTRSVGGMSTEEEPMSDELAHSGLLLAPGFLGLAYVLATLPEVGDPVTTPITGAWKFGLIATHVLIFVLVPVGMRVFHEALPALNVKRSGVFASQLGFAFIMVSIASEIGWHVTQSWFYTNDFTMLNFMFYYFFIAGFSILADGIRPKGTDGEIVDKIASGLLLLTSILYPLGAASDNSSFKIPIYVTLTFVTLLVTYRGWKVLDDWRVIFFPILSAGVNLYFIFLLDQHGDDVGKNALYHILHDLLGTEAGLVVLVWLFYLKIPKERLVQ